VTWAHPVLNFGAYSSLTLSKIVSVTIRNVALVTVNYVQLGLRWLGLRDAFARRRDVESLECAESIASPSVAQRAYHAPTYFCWSCSVTYTLTLNSTVKSV